ncbi:coactosin-like protein [Anaeramoeba flamelloides]|uniref:Coactosin-like protein n=1 Tax=Anaeramoeba flamelloides TaxID=1746091 RepID=A0AAV7YCV3_9EUKA|nr:coactosin-like protein [Anaeramoeba flamelloides]
MANVSDEAILDAYLDVRNDETETNWMACSYVGKTNDLEMIGSGSAGIDEMKALFDPTKVVYGYLRVVNGDSNTKRTLFVFLTFIGEKCGVMRRARVSVHKADVKQVIKEFAVEFCGSEVDEFDLNKIWQQSFKGYHYFN